MVGTIVDRTGPVSVLKVRLEGDEVVSRQVKLCLSSFEAKHLEMWLIKNT